jgi:hypothetical protein
MVVQLFALMVCVILLTRYSHSQKWSSHFELESVVQSNRHNNHTTKCFSFGSHFELGSVVPT